MLASASHLTRIPGAHTKVIYRASGALLHTYLVVCYNGTRLSTKVPFLLSRTGIQSMETTGRLTMTIRAKTLTGTLLGHDARRPGLDGFLQAQRTAREVIINAYLTTAELGASELRYFNSFQRLYTIGFDCSRQFYLKTIIIQPLALYSSGGGVMVKPMFSAHARLLNSTYCSTIGWVSLSLSTVIKTNPFTLFGAVGPPTPMNCHCQKM